MKSRLAAFVEHQHGMTGAEKALVACAALAIVAGAGSLVSRGSDAAASDAQRTLSRAGQGPAKLGEFQLVSAAKAPGAIQGAGAVQEAGPLAPAPAPAAPAAMPAPAPAPAPAPPSPAPPRIAAAAARPAPAPQRPAPPPVDRARLDGITGAATQALHGEWDRVRDMWRAHLPDPQRAQGWSPSAWRESFRLFRFTVGVGFSGQGALLQDLNRRVEDINRRFAELDQIRQQMRNENDPARLRQLGDRFSQRALELRDRIDSFRRDSGPFLSATERAARAWELGRDVYGLGTASNPAGALWNLRNLINHTVGR